MPDYSDRAALESEICRLQQEISRLHLLLDQAGINYEQTSIQEETQDTVLPVPITEAHAKLAKFIPKEHQIPAPEKLVSKTNQQAQGPFFIIQRLLNRGDTKGTPHNHSTKCWFSGAWGRSPQQAFCKLY